MENPFLPYKLKNSKFKKKKVKKEGIYVFGGRLKDGEATNKL